MTVGVNNNWDNLGVTGTITPDAIDCPSIKINGVAVTTGTLATEVEVTALAYPNADYNVLLATDDNGNLPVFASSGILFNPNSGELRAYGLKSTGVATNIGLEVTPVTFVPILDAGTVNLSTTVSTNIVRTYDTVDYDITISTGTINLPADPVDGQVCRLFLTGGITTLTGTVTSAVGVGSFGPSGLYTFVYNSATTKWFVGN